MALVAKEVRGKMFDFFIFVLPERRWDAVRDLKNFSDQIREQGGLPREIAQSQDAHL